MWDTSGNRLDWTIEPELDWNWVGGRGVTIGYGRAQERLVPGEEFPNLTVPKDFALRRYTVEFDSRDWARGSFGADIDWGTRINFVPPVGADQELADFTEAGLNLLLRPISPLQMNFRFLRNELHQPDGERIFTNTIGRALVNWQFNLELSLRVIAEFEDIDAVAGNTSLTDDERVTTDVLLRYLWNPWWVLYVGYNQSSRDILEFDGGTSSLVNLNTNGEQFFVKFSYLFQL